MVEAADLLVLDCCKLLTLAGPDRPRVGSEMNDLGAIDSGAVAIAGDIIVDIGPSDTLAAKYPVADRLSAAGGLVMPGMVDCHTHAVFVRPRAEELAQRIAGASYLDILAAGGGIHCTVQSVLSAAQEDLTQLTRSRFDAMLAHGTTTAEVKSGYGLRLGPERKMLRAAIGAATQCPIDIATTYLAHVVPPDMDRDAYVREIISEHLPALTDLAEFCDVFCEAEAFTLDETERLFEAARQLGYGLKVHAGQFNDLGAAGLAARLEAVSAEHLEHVSDDQLDAMAEASTVAALLPGAAFYMLRDDYPDARRMIERGVPVALATDFNPGSCPSYSMQTMISLAVLKLKMTAAEALTAATINAAHAIGRGDRIGSLEVGKQADLLILNVRHEAELPCHVGVNNVRQIIKAGRVV